MSDFGLDDPRVMMRAYLDEYAACVDLAVDDPVGDIDTLDDRLDRLRDATGRRAMIEAWQNTDEVTLRTSEEGAQTILREAFGGMIALGGTRNNG